MKRFYFTFLFFYCSFASLVGQDKSYKFLDLQITYPSSYCIIYDYEQESNLLEGNNCSFIVSAVFSNGSEERMKVEVTSTSSSAFELLKNLEMTKKEILEYCVESSFEGLKSAPVYSNLKNVYSITENNYGCIDYTGRFFRNKRIDDSAYYENIKGRIYAFYYGNYLIQFSMQVPSTNNYNTLMRIAKSLRYSQTSYYN